MRNNSNFGMVALVGIAAFMYWKFRTDARFSRYLQGLRVFIPKIEIKGNRVVVYFKIQNPSSMPVKVNSLVGDLYFNHTLVGNVSSFDVLTVNPNQESYTSVNVDVKFFPAMAEIYNIMATGRGANRLYFKGTINANDEPLLLNLTYPG